MKERMKRRRTLILVSCAAVLTAVEAGVCALVFIPQSRKLEHVAQQRRFVEEQLSVVVKAPETYNDMKEAIRRGRSLLTDLDLFRPELAQEVIMQAITRADNPGGVTIVELAPLAEQELAEEKRIGESWRLRCRGDFLRLTHFLNKIEMQCILLDGANFEADTTGKGAGIELTTVMRVFSQESLERLQEKASTEGKEEAARKS